MKVGLYLIEYTFYFYTFIETCPGSKGIAEGRKPSGHPDGAQAPEGSHIIHMGRRPERSEGCLAIARQDKKGSSAGQREGETK